MSFFSWGSWMWLVFVCMIVFFGIVVAPGCTDQQIGVETETVTPPEPENKWLDAQVGKCKLLDGRLSYDPNTKLAECFAPEKCFPPNNTCVPQLVYSNRWQGSQLNN